MLENVVDGVSEPDPETLATMLAQTRRLGRLVSQLLDLSRLEAGDQPFDIRPFVVRDVLESAAREARLHAPDDVVFSIDAPAELRAAGDPERIHQVVMNLVENAVRYSPRPGEIAMRASAAGHEVTVEVDDEGPGIPEEDLARVFERFYRGDGRRGADGGGAGLGLAIARWIVELHGGTITRRAPRAARQPHGRDAAGGALRDRAAVRARGRRDGRPGGAAPPARARRAWRAARRARARRSCGHAGHGRGAGSAARRRRRTLAERGGAARRCRRTRGGEGGAAVGRSAVESAGRRGDSPRRRRRRGARRAEAGASVDCRGDGGWRERGLAAETERRGADAQRTLAREPRRRRLARRWRTARTWAVATSLRGSCILFQARRSSAACSSPSRSPPRPLVRDAVVLFGG